MGRPVNHRGTNLANAAPQPDVRLLTMWISHDGRAIVNAWGEPATALPESVITLVDSLTAAELADFDAALDAALFDAFDEFEVFREQATPEGEAPFREQWLPPEVIGGLRAENFVGLLEELRNVPFRWRLDAYGVVQQYVETKH